MGGLAIEYSIRYGDDAQQKHGELLAYPPGYTPLYDRPLPSEEIGRHPFEKLLACGGSHEDTA